MSCNRCNGTSTDPYNFLLSCSNCPKRWHHRCHIPPLSDAELTALIRATNHNDIDNGLSSWIGKCCRRKRAQVPEAVSRPAEIPRPQTHSVSSALAAPLNAASIRQVSQKPDLTSVPHRHDQTRKTSRDSVAASLEHDSGHTTRDLGRPSPQTPTEPQMTTLVRPAVQRSATVFPDMASATPERSRTMPLPSTSYTAASPSSNVTSTSIPHSRPTNLGEISLPLSRTLPSQATDSTHVQTHSQSSKSASTSRSVGPALANSESIEIDIDPPTLDFSALTLTQAAPSGSSSHRKAAAPSRPPNHSPSPPPTRPAAAAAAAAEDDEIEELYGPPLGFPSVHAPPQPPLPPREPSPQPLQPPAEPAPAPAPAKPPLLPVLAAEDPRVLEALERHERHEAARPRQGTRKMRAVPRAGARRGGFVLVADRAAAAAEAEAVDRCREPRGVFASYFARSRAWN